MNENDYDFDGDEDDDEEEKNAEYERELERIVTIFRKNHNESTTHGVFMGTQMPRNPRKERRCEDKDMNWLLVWLFMPLIFLGAIGFLFGVPILMVRFPPGGNPITYREALQMWFDLLILIPLR